MTWEDNALTKLGPKEAARYHELRAIHLRDLVERATTPRMKEWLLEQADEEERMATVGDGWEET
jgi:hypothetical protein